MRHVWVPSAVVVLGLLGAPAEAQPTYRPCDASADYDGCECRGYRRGQDQVVAPSTHPTRPELCNLINLQTAFDYAVGAGGEGLAVVLLRGERYALSGPVYDLRGQTVVETVNDGVIRARAHGQRWTSSGSGPYPRISLPPFRGYDEHAPVGCETPPGPDRGSGRKPRSPERRPSVPCPRHPKHQMQIFDAEGHRVTIDHLELDGGLDPSCAPRMPPFGGRRRYFRRPALVELGGSALASGTAFHDNVVLNAAGWTALHLFEGPLDESGAPACRGVEVHGNTISDLGWNLCDPVTGRDGNPPQCYWADGISMACAGSVRQNTIRNPTDVGIVAFVGDVSIEGNVVSSDRGKAFGGIAAVTEFERSDGTWVAQRRRHTHRGEHRPGGSRRRLRHRRRRRLVGLELRAERPADVRQLTRDRQPHRCGRGPDQLRTGGDAGGWRPEGRPARGVDPNLRSDALLGRVPPQHVQGGFRCRDTGARLLGPRRRPAVPTS